MPVITNLKQLYETDHIQWLEETVELLKHRQFKDLDLDNLIEELEDLGSEKKNAVESLLDQVIRHLLLLAYWQEERDYNATHWQYEVYNFRLQLQRRLTTTLSNYLDYKLDAIYQSSVKAVRIKTNRKVDFPINCPYTLEQLLDMDWLPE
ncbi:MAG: DUF29 domain-containing protein [Microcystaceae cyanobacterium]